MLRHRFLFGQMVRRELRQKYKGSALGVVWYLVNPLVLMGAYAVMFGVALRVVSIPDYPLFLLVGLAVWVFFSQSLLAAAPSLVEQSALVRKVAFPRTTIPGAVVLVQLVTFGVLLALLVPVIVAVRGTLGLPLLLLPVIVAALAAFVLGLALCAAVLQAYFRDVVPVLTAALLPWFFLTPIYFRVSDAPGVADRPWLGHLLSYGNPVAPFVEGLRDVLYDGRAPSLGTLAYVLVAGLIALLGGLTVFSRLQRELAVVL